GRSYFYLPRCTPSQPHEARRVVGELLAPLTSDVQRVEDLVFNGPVTLIRDVAAAAFFTSVLFVMNWQLALVALATAPLLAWLVLRRAPPAQRAARGAPPPAAPRPARAGGTPGALPPGHPLRPPRPAGG